MIAEGQIVLFRFPHTDQETGKLRPALVLRKLPGQYDDWLICMISSKLDQGIAGFDEVITHGDADFDASGLKMPSLLRTSRLAVVNGEILLGKLGQVEDGRLVRIKQRISEWVNGRGLAK